MAFFIRKNDKSKLYSTDLFLKNSFLERRKRVPINVLQNFKIKKAPARGAFLAEGILASQ